MDRLKNVKCKQGIKRANRQEFRVMEEKKIEFLPGVGFQEPGTEDSGRGFQF